MGYRNAMGMDEHLSADSVCITHRTLRVSNFDRSPDGFPTIPSHHGNLTGSTLWQTNMHMESNHFQ